MFYPGDIDLFRYLGQYHPSGSVAGLAVLSLAVTIGLVLGNISIAGIKLGVSGVLFSALLMGQLGLTTDHEVLLFLRDFSLILFVYTIGLQVGPGFVESLRSEGLQLNLLSIAVLVVGAGMTAVCVALTGLNKFCSTGLYAGAFTTTAGLAAGQEALSHLFRGDQTTASQAVAAAGLAYAVTYPAGLVGPVLMLPFMAKLFRIDMKKERQDHLTRAHTRRPPGAVVDVEVTNPAMDGHCLKELDFVHSGQVVFSRLLRGAIMTVPTSHTRIELGDMLRAIGEEPVLEQVVATLGKRSEIDLASIPSDVARKELIVTRKQVIGKTLRELNLIKRTGVVLATMTRAGVALIPRATTTLRFGDSVTAVGPQEGLAALETELGNSPDELARPQLIPIFLGVVLGIVVGSIPVMLPGLHATIKLGLAGGPMLAAIVLSRLGKVGSVVWYMPAAASSLMREFGLAVFLACVGLQQGDHFVQKLFTPGGLAVVAWGLVITTIPLLLVAILARLVFKMNFLTLTGWAAGAMTSTPALLYAGDMTQSDAPALAYAAVAPLAMIVPILCCQVLATLR
jgi:putative transport protein